jgi:hypothetical protein
VFCSFVRAIKKQSYHLVCILTLLVTTSVLSAETRIKLSDLAPGTEVTSIVANGDFENGDIGWTVVTTNVHAGPAPANVSVPSSTESALALAYIDNDGTLGQYRRTITLQGDTEYVLSAYMWELGDDNHHVSVVVVDLGDAGNGTPNGIWEGQLTLYPGTEEGRKGYFVYDAFTTPPGEQTVTLRLFYTGLTETDDNWPSFPVGAMWDNVAITKAAEFSQPLPYDPCSGDSLAGDLDDDEDVDFNDLRIFAGDWSCQDCESISDLDNNGKVDFADYSRLAANFNISRTPVHGTLHGKIMCGYQGWFNCPDDGAARGWVHWGKSGGFEPGKCSVDMWPDMREYPDGFSARRRRYGPCIQLLYRENSAQTLFVDEGLRHRRGLSPAVCHRDQSGVGLPKPQRPRHASLPQGRRPVRACVGDDV